MTPDPRLDRPDAPATPPRAVEWLLGRLLPAGVVRDCIVGDLREEYAQRARTHSPVRASLWYVSQSVGIATRGARDRVRGHGPLTSAGARRINQKRGDGMISNLVRALRYGAKGLARSPQFTIAAVVTLALAIGANAAIFSVVQGVLLKPLQYADADELVMLRHSAAGLGYDDIGMSPGLYYRYRGEGAAFASSGLYTEATVNLTGDEGAPERLDALRASRDVFATLRATPALGRIFDAAEDSPGGADAVLLSHGLWQDRFGADQSIVGRTVTIDGSEHVVVGVMPAGFAFPNRGVRLWLPLAMDTMTESYGQFSFDAVARLRNGVDAEQAQTSLRPALTRLRGEAIEGGSSLFAFMDAGNLTPMVRPLKEMVVGDVTRPLWILLGTVAFVFLIACANVTNLFLVRAEARQKEMAVRAAMGAGRSGLIGHYAAESALIAAAGGGIGLLLASIGLDALLSIAPPNIPRLDEVAIDPIVLGFTIGVTGIAAVLLGLLPAVRLTSPNLLSTLGRATRGMTAARERHRARHALVVAQTALALVLLVGTGLMVRSFQNIRAVEPGFEPQNALTFRISLPSSTYLGSERVAQFHSQLLERLRQVPGVEHVGATTHAPLASCCSGTAHAIEDFPVEPGQMPPMFWYSTVTHGYFETMGIPLVSGRYFDSSDAAPDRNTVIVSRALAQRFWPNADAVGERLQMVADTARWFTIVGVVEDVRDRGLELDASEMAYYPMGAGLGEVASTPPSPRNMTYVIRTRRGEAMAPLARAEVWALDETLPVAATATYDEIVSDSMVRLSFTMLALIAASAVALVLGAVGLYSVISYIVTQRTNEIGIRLALGARPQQVRSMVVRQGVILAGLGLVVGFGAALALTRLMQGMLYGTEPNDPLTFILVGAFLAGITLLATYVPAWRASRIDPASSLKVE